MAQQQNPFEQVEDFNKRIQEYSLRFSKALTSGVAPTIRAQADVAASSLEKAVENSEKLMNMKSPQEMIALQTELMNELASNFQTNVKKLLEAQNELGQEFQKLLHEGMSLYNLDALKSMFDPKK